MAARVQIASESGQRQHLPMLGMETQCRAGRITFLVSAALPNWFIGRARSSSIRCISDARPWRHETPDRVSAGQGLFRAGGRYWDRTSDLFRVREARYRCANRPREGD